MILDDRKIKLIKILSKRQRYLNRSNRCIVLIKIELHNYLTVEENDF